MGAVHLCFKRGFNCKVTVIKVNIKKKKKKIIVVYTIGSTASLLLRRKVLGLKQFKEQTSWTTVGRVRKDAGVK